MNRCGRPPHAPRGYNASSFRTARTPDTRRAILDVFRHRSRCRSPAVPNDVRAADTLVPWRSMGRCPDPSAFPAMLPLGGAWRLLVLGKRPPSSPWPDLDRPRLGIGDALDRPTT